MEDKIRTELIKQYMIEALVGTGVWFRDVAEAYINEYSPLIETLNDGTMSSAQILIEVGYIDSAKRRK